MATVLDLSPYGLHLPLGGLTPQTDLSTLGLDILASAQSHHKGVEIDGLHYSVVKKVTDGAFGDIYKVERKGVPYACKILKALKTTDDFQALLCETLIHILLLQVSVGELNGPYVPYFYKIGYDKKMHKTYLLTEWMSHTLDEEIVRHSKSENDSRLPTILGQVAKILTFYGECLRFNHRDLHTGNVMIARSFRRVVLIDFGYSCLTWNGLQIKGPSLYNDDPNPCFKPDRDIPFLLAPIYAYFAKHISKSLRKHIHTMLQGYVHVQTTAQDPAQFHLCDVGEMCPKFGLSKMDDRYIFLNLPEVHVPRSSTARVARAFQTMRLRTNRRGRATRRRLPANRTIRTIPADS